MSQEVTFSLLHFWVVDFHRKEINIFTNAWIWYFMDEDQDNKNSTSGVQKSLEWDGSITCRLRYSAAKWKRNHHNLLVLWYRLWKWLSFLQMRKETFKGEVICSAMWSGVPTCSTCSRSSVLQVPWGQKTGCLWWGFCFTPNLRSGWHPSIQCLDGGAELHPGSPAN